MDLESFRTHKSHACPFTEVYADERVRHLVHELEYLLRRARAKGLIHVRMILDDEVEIVRRFLAWAQERGYQNRNWGVVAFLWDANATEQDRVESVKRENLGDRVWS